MPSLKLSIGKLCLVDKISKPKDKDSWVYGDCVTYDENSICVTKLNDKVKMSGSTKHTTHKEYVCTDIESITAKNSVITIIGNIELYEWEDMATTKPGMKGAYRGQKKLVKTMNKISFRDIYQDTDELVAKFSK